MSEEKKDFENDRYLVNRKGIFRKIYGNFKNNEICHEWLCDPIYPIAMGINDCYAIQGLLLEIADGLEWKHFFVKRSIVFDITSLKKCLVNYGFDLGNLFSNDSFLIDFLLSVKPTIRLSIDFVLWEELEHNPENKKYENQKVFIKTYTHIFYDTNSISGYILAYPDTFGGKIELKNNEVKND